MEHAQSGLTQENERKWPIRNEHRWLSLRAEYAQGGYRNDQDVIDHRLIAVINILEVKSVHVVHLEELVLRPRVTRVLNSCVRQNDELPRPYCPCRRIGFGDKVCMKCGCCTQQEVVAHAGKLDPEMSPR